MMTFSRASSLGEKGFTRFPWKDAHALLRLVAVRRATAGSGRPSVSDVITDLIERHRAELETEARG